MFKAPPMSIFNNLIKNEKIQQYMQVIWMSALLNHHATNTTYSIQPSSMKLQVSNTLIMTDSQQLEWLISKTASRKQRFADDLVNIEHSPLS